MGMISRAEIEKKAVDIFPEVFKAATDWERWFEKASGKPAYPAERFEFTGNVVDVNKLFFEKGWSLGIPIIPPTHDGVSEMLKGTSRKPDEVIGQMRPRMLL